MIACMEMRLRPARLRPPRLHPARLHPARLRPAGKSGPTTDTRRQTDSGAGVGVVDRCKRLTSLKAVDLQRG